MSEILINTKHKDRLFVKLFGSLEYKGNIISLYNALNGTKYPEDYNDIEITTLEDAICMGMKNDVSLIINSYLSLWEQQSTWNPNMPIRGLMYFGKTYEAYIDKLGKERLYGRNLIMIPTPKYVVFYNGEEMADVPEISKLKLSDAFIQKQSDSDFEWTATVYNLTGEKNKALLEACKPLAEYMAFIKAIRENRANGLDNREAIKMAINDCIKKGILRDFLSKHRAEVFDVCLTEFDPEAYEKIVREESWEDGRRAGRSEGRREGENLLACLIVHLEKDNRISEITKAATDAKYREALYKEYHLDGGRV